LDVQPSENRTNPAAPPPSSCPPLGADSTSPASNPSSPSPKTATAASPSDTPTSSTPPPLYRSISTAAIIVSDPNNARTTPPDERIATLANNIQQIGLLNPITVRPLGNGYELVAGLGRLLAVRSLGWPEIPANVRPGNDTDSALARLSENVIRSNITPVEEAMQLHTLVEADDQGTIGVAIQLGRSQSWVEDRLDILTWPANLIAHVHEHRISLAAAKHLARISDPVTQTMYINDAARNGISARTAAQWRASANADAGDGPDPPDFSVGTPISPVQTTTFAICFCCRQPKSIDETRAARICSDCALQLGTAPTAETHTVVTQQPTAPTHHGNTARPLPDDEVHPRLLQTNPLPPPP